MTGILYGFLCLVWSSTWLFIKIGLEGVPPFLGAGLRFLLATSVLWAYLLLRSKKTAALTRDDKISIVSSGATFAVNYGLVYWSEQFIASGLAAILFSVMPLMVACLSRFWTRSETLPPRKALGILIGIAGTGFLFWPEAAVGRHAVWGMMGTLGAMTVASVNLVVMKRHSRHTDVFVLNAAGMAIGAAGLLLASFVSERHIVPVWKAGTVLSVLYLGLFGTVGAFLVYYHLLKTMDATHLSMTTLICPAAAIALGWAFLGEMVTLKTWIGIAAILGGVGLTVWPVSLRRWRPAEAPPP